MNGEISFIVDDVNERVTTICSGAVTDETLNQGVAKLIGEHPQIIRYDSLTDVRLLEDILTSAGIDELAQRWAEAAGHADRGTRTALVVRQIRPRTLVWPVAVRFPNRDFEVFTSIERAAAWLDNGLAARRSRASAPPDLSS